MTVASCADASDKHEAKRREARGGYSPTIIQTLEALKLPSGKNISELVSVEQIVPVSATPGYAIAMKHCLPVS